MDEQLPAWQDVLGDAEQVVRQKPIFSKYIKGTILENDVPVWMATFAQQAVMRDRAARRVPDAVKGAYEHSYGTENRMQLPPGYEVTAEDVQASAERGSWKCGACGFQGFWRGGPHCMWTGGGSTIPGAKVGA